MNLRKYIPGTFEYVRLRKEQILNTYQKKERAKNIIVSMTTYEPRLHVFEYTVLSILRGSLLPEKILIYVPKGFRQQVLDNEQSFLKLELDSGLIELIEMAIDMRCHSKYFYSFQHFGATKDIVICDDDMIYYRDWLKHLVGAAKKYVDYQVLAYKAVDVKCMNTKIAPYEDWTHCNRRHRGSNKALYAEGVGGVYYRKNSFNGQIFDANTFLKLAPNADDVWLWFWTHFNGYKVKFIPVSCGRKLQYIIPSSQDNALWIENTINRRNDIYVSNCYSYFLNNLGFDMVQKLSAQPNDRHG